MLDEVILINKGAACQEVKAKDIEPPDVWYCQMLLKKHYWNSLEDAVQTVGVLLNLIKVREPDDVRPRIKVKAPDLWFIALKFGSGTQEYEDIMKLYSLMVSLARHLGLKHDPVRRVWCGKIVPISSKKE